MAAHPGNRYVNFNSVCIYRAYRLLFDPSFEYVYDLCFVVFVVVWGRSISIISLRGDFTGNSGGYQ